MYDYTSLRKIVALLAVFFGVVMVVFVYTSLPLNKFAWLSVLLLVVVGAYFTIIPLRLIRELQQMEERAERYKQLSQQKKD